MRPGDILHACNPDDRADNVYLVVEAVHRHPTFASLLHFHGITNVLPDKTTISEGVQVYKQFYSAEQEAAHGVLGIQIHKLFD